MTKYWRVRFKSDSPDPRPVTFPPSGPYWISGYHKIYAVLIAYLPEKSDLYKFWPEASNPDWGEQKNEIEFSERFPKPDWWIEK